MSLARDLLDNFRRAGSAARAELDSLLSAAGLVVTELVPDGEGWRMRVAPASAGAAPAPREVLRADRFAWPEGRPTSEVEPLVRRSGETLMALVSRADGRLRIRRAESGEGGILAVEVPSGERVRLLGGTLVGDTVLALRHLGEPADSDEAIAELRRQFGMFEQESMRLVGTRDPGPFLAAIEWWTPPTFPRGDAFLAGLEGTYA